MVFSGKDGWDGEALMASDAGGFPEGFSGNPQPTESPQWLLPHSLLVPLTPLPFSFQLVPFELTNVDYVVFNFCFRGVFADGGTSFLKKL